VTISVAEMLRWLGTTELSRVNLFRNSQFHSVAAIRISVEKANGGERRWPFSPV
jgi:hypothetical protein